MGDSYVVDGGKLKCSFGDKESDFKVPMDHNVILCDKAQGNIMDFKPNVNIMPFGKCSSLANPTVAAATAANYGRLQKMPCIPVTTMPWIGGKTDNLLDNIPAMLKSSTNMCMWCGRITITDDGQSDGEKGEEKTVYDDCFTFTDKETGEPLEGVRYVLELENGERLEGVTGKNGQTVKIHSNKPESVKIYMYPQTEVII